MKIKSLIFAAMILVAQSAFAQTTTTQTVLASAITTTTATTLVVASATGITASTGIPGTLGTTGQQYVYVDREQMLVRAVSGTTLTVVRAQGSTSASLHNTGAVVFFGPGGGTWPAGGGNTGSGNVFGGPFSSVTPFGPCTVTGNTFLPVVNIRNGDVSTCVVVSSTIPGTLGTSGSWQTTSFAQYAYSMPVTNLNDVAYSALLTDGLINYVGLSTGRTVTLPAITGFVGKVFYVKNSTSNGSTITIAGSNGQGVGTGPAPLSQGTISQVGPGSVTRLVSVAVINGATSNQWTWVTW